MRSLDSDETNDKIAEIIHDTNFEGASGRIQFSQGGSRFADVNVLQWQENDFVLVGTYRPEIFPNRTSNDGVLKINYDHLKWLSGERPSDGRESCWLESVASLFGTDCQKISSLLIILTCILMVLACSGLSFMFWKRKFDKKLKDSNGFMDKYGFLLNNEELGRWEIPRGNIVINRRIGEGTFGTVFGGEALIHNDDGWSSVAVKTLKADSTPENRLDFFAEAETMKNFDHKNTVKLLAVCLQAEPLYVVMELMLYGDLKNFLLARRHLVNDKINDDSDVSSKRLTLMALDVAR